MSEPVLTVKGLKIDPLIFTQGFVAGCDLGICHGKCCHAGVWLDVDFKPAIMKYEKEIIDCMEDDMVKDSSKWFSAEKEEDSDFPSGYAYGTEVYTDKKGEEKCVFNDSIGRCVLQMAAVNNGMHKWEIKPKYCILYPVTVIEETVTYDDDHSNTGLDYCGQDKEANFTQTVFEAMTEELKYLLGEDGYSVLNEFYKRNYKPKYQITINK